VTGGDDVDAVRRGGIDDALAESDVRFVGAGVFLGEGIREIGIEQ